MRKNMGGKSTEERGGFGFGLGRGCFGARSGLAPTVLHKHPCVGVCHSGLSQAGPRHRIESLENVNLDDVLE